MRAVLLVDDAVFDPADPDFSKHSRWPKNAMMEYSVAGALRDLGHDVVGVGASTDVDSILKRIRAASPDFVFNLVEEIDGCRGYDSLIVQLLELIGVPYTGASSQTLSLTRNKQLAKLVAAEAGVAVAKGVVIRSDLKFSVSAVRFPAIIKPMGLDGSDGVTSRSYVMNAAELKRRLPSFKQWAPLLCEEYVRGRELIVTLSGTNTVSVDSICEMVFPPGSPVQFATDLAKFDPIYRKRFGITYRTPARLDRELNARVSAQAKRVYRALAIDSYAKLEFRVDGGHIVFIEANANSQLSRFANSTDFASIGYERFINKIIRMALARDRCAH